MISESGDVFASGLRLPPRVAVVAPGPRGQGRYGDIPGDAYVIAVSKAVLIPEIRPRLWMMNHVHQDWYPEASRRFTGVRVFSHEAAVEAGGPCYHFVPPEEPLDPDVLRSVEGCVRYGTTVTGCAVQLAYNLGAREILLCGADFSGDGYFDGTVNPQPFHGEAWPATRALGRLVRWLEAERGVRVATLSETTLDVPWYRREAACAS